MSHARALWLSTACLVAACASEAKAPLDDSALDAIDIDGKEDSLRSPTVKGAMEMGGVTTSRVTRARSFHAYDYTYTGQQGLVRLDARNAAGEDLIVAAYRRTGSSWKLAAWNDDCGDGSLNACLALPATAGRYRFVISTFDALIGAPRAADYEFAISCKDGDCLAPVACGGRAGDSCRDDQFCAFTPADVCGRADAQGTCEARPEICTQDYTPVCGCDNVTYSNACTAAAAGVGVLATGACVPE